MDTIVKQSHYKVFNITSIDEVRKIFPDGKADLMNWLFLSTSGVHGSYQTLDDNNKQDVEREDDGKRYVTVLIVHPRLVTIRYGNIEYNEEDESYLRSLVESTLDAVKGSQEGNLSPIVS